MNRVAIVFCLLAAAIGRIGAQCPAGTSANGPCINDMCLKAGETCVNQMCCDATAVGGVSTTTPFGFTSVTGVTGVTGVTAAPPSGCIGPCFDNECPTSYSCSNNFCCSTGSVTSTPGSCTCVDKVKAFTGISDCPRLAYLCNDATYYDLMTEQCPKTCKRCPGCTTAPGVGGNNTTCVDKKGPNGISDCPTLSYLCTNKLYAKVMRDQCPKTCGFCGKRTSG